jgi:hypothetical protein
MPAKPRPKLGRRKTREKRAERRLTSVPPHSRSEEGVVHGSGARVFELGRGWGGGGLRGAIVLLRRRVPAFNERRPEAGMPSWMPLQVVRRADERSQESPRALART